MFCFWEWSMVCQPGLWLLTFLSSLLSKTISFCRCDNCSICNNSCGGTSPSPSSQDTPWPSYPSEPSPISGNNPCNSYLSVIGYCQDSTWIVDTAQINNQLNFSIMNTEVLFQGDLNIPFLNFSNTSVQITGNFISSHLTMEDCVISIAGDWRINEGTVYITTLSVLYVSGDVDLRNTEFTIDMGNSVHLTETVLVHSNSTKPMVLPHFHFVNVAPYDCPQVEYRATLNSIVVLSRKGCGEKSEVSIVGPIVGSIVGLLIVGFGIFLIIWKKEKVRQDMSRLRGALSKGLSK
eukprot:TRINITY_DN5545_c0_g1_i4.p1 TRINITY_DN5545_c0_g1~~TRINITY_DN5545_c0_g1_i4.p1  ORF type:complete len:292 (+),score=51.94 TRINITY_DN5545_c0_g1_i4:98-973(+)